jgi:hypothetical protein
MAAVAEGLVLRRAAATQRHARVFPNQLVVRVDDANETADEERAVRARLDRRFLLRLLLASAIEPAVVERAGRTGLDRGRDSVCIGRVDDDPGPRLWNEHLRQLAHAVANVDAKPRFPLDLDRLACVRTRRASLLLRGRCQSGTFTSRPTRSA